MFVPPPSSSSDLDPPSITVHQSDDEAKELFYSERTVFLRCAADSNPPVHFTWLRGREVLSEGVDAGVEIYRPFFTEVGGVRTSTLSVTPCVCTLLLGGVIFRGDPRGASALGSCSAAGR